MWCLWECKHLIWKPNFTQMFSYKRKILQEVEIWEHSRRKWAGQVRLLLTSPISEAKGVCEDNTNMILNLPKVHPLNVYCNSPQPPACRPVLIRGSLGTGLHRKKKKLLLLPFIYFRNLNIFFLENYQNLSITSVYDSLMMHFKSGFTIFTMFRKYHSFHASHIMFLCRIYSPHLKGWSLKILPNIKLVCGTKKVGDCWSIAPIY